MTTTGSGIAGPPRLSIGRATTIAVGRPGSGPVEAVISLMPVNVRTASTWRRLWRVWWPRRRRRSIALA